MDIFRKVDSWTYTLGKYCKAVARSIQAERYAGLAAKGATAAEAGLFWANTAATISEAFLVAGTAAGTLAFGAAMHARWQCWGIQ